MDLSIIIVNYKSKNKLKACLDSIKQDDLSDLKYEIILVENNSGDDLSDILPLDSDVKLILSKRNVGMGKGNNLGIKAASGEYLLVLNPDTILKRPTIKILLSYIKEHQGVGIVGPKLFYPDGSLQLSCAKFPSFFVPILRRTFLGEYFKETRDRFTMSEFDHNSIKEVDWLMGSCLLFKREIELEDGKKFHLLFDERYFMYFEDIDLAREFKKKGLKRVYLPEAVVIHNHSRDSAKHAWYIAVFKDKLTWVHIISWFKYFIKWGFKV
ncbi:MAG TPA: glycosyltransferase family 2 protein [Patescibacteria group bacterium]|nr:glycosyltransferase family 2 protein [Patescibacteria group bacterium]